LRRGKNGEEQASRRLASVTRRGDDAQCASTNPAAAALVAESWTPAAATYDVACRTPPVSNRTCADDEEDSRAIVERIVHGDQTVGVNHDFFRELHRIERGVEGATLFIAAGAGDTAVEHARKHRARLCDL